MTGPRCGRRAHEGSAGFGGSAAAALAIFAAVAIVSCRSAETRALVLLDITVADDVPAFEAIECMSLDRSFEKAVRVRSSSDRTVLHVGFFVADPKGSITIVADARDGRGCSVGRGSKTVQSVFPGKQIDGGALSVGKLSAGECPSDAGAARGTAGAGGASAGGAAGAAGGRAGATGGRAGATGGRAGVGGNLSDGNFGGNTGGTTGGAAVLSGPTTHDFGPTEVNVVSVPFAWTITNTGDQSTGPLKIEKSDWLAVEGTCPSLAAGNSCTLSITIKATADSADLAGDVTIRDERVRLTLQVAAKRQYRITVTVQGVGIVTSSPTGITCGTTCTSLFGSEAVELRAQTTNGSGYRFASWDSRSCPPFWRSCRIRQTSTKLTATFEPVTSNLVFITSKSVRPTKGSGAAYDADCNVAASDAGINNAAGNGYIAFRSDPNQAATARLPAAVKGWVRMDGKPFAMLPDLFKSNAVLYPIMFDEYGGAAGFPATGTGPAGRVEATCAGWTSTIAAEGATMGGPFYGPGKWTAASTGSCVDLPVLCLGTSGSAAPPLPAPPAGAKKIWVTNTPYLVGAQTPDQKCNAERPAGVTSAAAFISKVGAPAATVLFDTATYVRLDGMVVGTGAELAERQALSTGIWQSADGQYLASTGDNVSVWTGEHGPRDEGRMDMTCNNWTSSGPGGADVGDPTITDLGWWTHGGASCTNTTFRLYCVQTAP